LFEVNLPRSQYMCIQAKWPDSTYFWNEKKELDNTSTSLALYMLVSSFADMLVTICIYSDLTLVICLMSCNVSMHRSEQPLRMRQKWRKPQENG
jgi:hypothetical protein